VNADLNDGLNINEAVTIKNADIGNALYNANEANSGNMTILRGRDEYSSNSDTYFEPSVENLAKYQSFSRSKSY